MRLKSKGILLFILCILIYSFSGTELLKELLLSLHQDSGFWLDYLNLIFYGSFLILFFIVYRKGLAELSADFVSNNSAYTVLIVRGFIILILSMIAASAVLSIFGINSSSNQQAIEEALKSNFFLASIISILIGPFVEEMLFRFHLYELFIGKKRNRKKFAMIGTSLCFALYHTTIHNIISFNYIELLSLLPIFCIGLVLAHLQEKTHNLLCPLILHMSWNLFATIVDAM